MEADIKTATESTTATAAYKGLGYKGSGYTGLGVQGLGVPGLNPLLSIAVVFELCFVRLYFSFPKQMLSWPYHADCYFLQDFL